MSGLMENDNKSSLIRLDSTGLVKANNTIAITSKLLAESKFEFSGDFKGAQVWNILAHEMAINEILISNSIFKSCLVSVGDDGFVCAFDLSSGENIFRENIDPEGLSSVAILENEIFCGSNSGKLHRFLFDENLFKNEPIQAHTDCIMKIIVSQNNELITCSSDKKIKVWRKSINKIEEKLEIVADSEYLFDALFLPNNELITCGQDKNIKVWNIINKNLIHQFEGHTSQVNCIDFNTNKNIIASGSLDSTLKIWDIKTKKCLITVYPNTNNVITGLSFSSDGNYLVATYMGGISIVFDTKTYDEICQYSMHNKDKAYMSTFVGEKPTEVPNDINSVVFDDNNKSIYTASIDGRIHKWQ